MNRIYWDIGQISMLTDALGASTHSHGMIQFFLYDDSPDACNNIYYFKRVNSKEEYRTEIYLVDTEHDIDVMKMIKNI